MGEKKNNPLSCPFCSNRSEVSNGVEYGHRVVCTICYVTTPDYASRETAIRAWNYRVPNYAKLYRDWRKLALGLKKEKKECK